MKIKSFTVKNYRSIIDKSTIDFNDITVLVGKNNIGKSNILSALNCAMGIIRKPERYMRQRVIRPIDDNEYDIERDYPVQLKNKQGRRPTSFILEFELNNKEKRKIEKIVEDKIHKTITIKIVVKLDARIDIEVLEMPNQSGSLYRDVCKFIAENISFCYIPAVRTEETSKKLLQTIIKNELRSLRNDKQYKDAIKTVLELQNKTLKKLSRQLISPLSVFVDNISNVDITNNSESVITPYVRDVSIEINDGVSTDIAYKGDGIKNLIALAILNNNNDYNAIVAIEEPESHLHPEAMRKLYDVINEISAKKQVVITTHNPLFVRRNNLSSNFIVEDNGARKTKSINEIRKILGIISSDNLENADKALLVEGETDKIYLEKILSCKSTKLKYALSSNSFIIEPLHGASKLNSEIHRMNNNLCNFVVLLDNDDSGNDAYDKALESKIILEKQCFVTNCKGQSKSEFEDCIRIDAYEKELYKQYGVNINTKEFRSNKDVWSNRIKKEFVNSGKHFTDSKEEEIKFFVANIVSSKINKKSFNKIINTNKCCFIEKLVEECEQIL